MDIRPVLQMFYTFSILSFSTLYYTILYYIILYYTILYYTILYFSVASSTARRLDGQCTSVFLPVTAVVALEALPGSDPILCV